MADPAPKTSYELIERAKNELPDCNDSLSKIISIYRPFILVICQKHLPFNKSHAEDVAHDFIASRMIAGNVVQSFDSRKEVPFRSYLRKCVVNFCKSFCVKEARLQSEWQVQPDEFSHDPEIMAEDDSVWARSVIANAVRDLKANCYSENKEYLWHAFHDQVLAPVFLGTTPRLPEYFDTDRQTLSNWQVTGYRKLRRFVTNQVRIMSYEENVLRTTSLILELLKQPLASEPVVQQLLSKSFSDEQVSRIFLSKGCNIELKALYPSQAICVSEVQRQWLGLLQSRCDQYCKTIVSDFDNAFTVDEVIFGTDKEHSKQRTLLRKAAKKRIELSANADKAAAKPDIRIHFAVYTLVICSSLIADRARETSLNTLQLGHNIRICQKTEWLDEDCHELLKNALAIF